MRFCNYNSNTVYSPLLKGFYDLRANDSVCLQDFCSLSELEALCQIIGPAGVRTIDLKVITIGHEAMDKISTVLKRNKDLIAGVDMYKFYEEDRWSNIVRRFSGLEIISKQGVIIGSIIAFRQLLRKALYNVINERCSFYAQSMRTIHDKLEREKLFFENLSHLSLDCGIFSPFSDNVMRNVFYQFSKEQANMWQYVPLIFGLCFADAFWKNNTSYDMRLGALTNNGFAVAHCVSMLISIFNEHSAHRSNKLLFLDIAGRTLLNLKKNEPKNENINHIFLFLDYFIEICDDLTPMDLQSFSIKYDVIRAQLVTSFGDSSGFFTDSQLQDKDDDAKNEDI